MEQVIIQINNLLIKRQKTVAVAESCTGGLVCDMLTQISGSSGYFILGLVAYSNRAKETILKIPHHLILKEGAVSKEVAEKMAKNIRKSAKSDFGIGVTGIAGPAGRTAKKPIGTVFISIDSQSERISKRFLFTGNRTTIRKKAALKCIELLTSLVLKEC